MKQALNIFFVNCYIIHLKLLKDHTLLVYEYWFHKNNNDKCQNWVGPQVCANEQMLNFRHFRVTALCAIAEESVWEVRFEV